MCVRKNILDGMVERRVITESCACKFENGVYYVGEKLAQR